MYINNLEDFTSCFVWIPASRREHRLKVFEDTVLRAISGPLREHATKGWITLPSVELHYFLAS
jgi:hypothetical protein